MRRTISVKSSFFGVQADVDEGGPQTQAATDRAACADVAPAPATPGKGAIAGTGHAACGGPRPGPAPTAARPAAATSHVTPPANHNRKAGKADALSSATGPSTARCAVEGHDAAKMSPRICMMQQRCHHASASARSPSSPPMPRPSLQRASTARQEKFQLPIVAQNLHL
jgi:hypothetical protein